MRRRQGDETAIRIAQWSVAKTLRFLHHIGTPADAATSLQDEGKNDGYVFEELAGCLLALGQRQEVTSDSPTEPCPVDNHPDRPAGELSYACLPTLFALYYINVQCKFVHHTSNEKRR